MTEPLDGARGELAAEINTAFEKYLNAANSATKEIEARELRQILWDNIAGIIAYLRPAPVPQCEAEEPVAPRRMHDSSTGDSYWQDAKGDEWEGPARCDAESADALLATVDAIISDNVYVDNDGVAGISSAAEAILAYFVPPPSEAGREELLDLLLSKVPSLKRVDGLPSRQALDLTDAILALSPDPGTVLVQGAIRAPEQRSGQPSAENDAP